MEEVSKKFVRFKINKGDFGSLTQACSFLKSSGVSFRTNGASTEIWSEIIIIVNTDEADEMEVMLKDHKMLIDRSEPSQTAFVNA